MNILRHVRNRFGVGVLILVFAGAAANVWFNDKKVAPKADDTIRIRICHWHLEAVQGFDRIIDGFQKEYFQRTGKRVLIEQVAVPYTGYAQYINTSLIGRMAPDIIQIGCSGQLANVSNIVRYFVPLGEYVLQPNPYNEGTDLEGLPWRETFIDELRGNMEPSLQEYFTIPLSTQTTRLFYNKDMLKKITGGTEFPDTFTGLLLLCERVSRFHEQTGGEPVSPIAACYFQEGMFNDTYRESFLHDLAQECDFNFDGIADELETAARYRDVWTFDSPRFIGSWECFRQVVKHFMPGWTAAARDDMMFAFVQERAFMTLTFGYDVKMIYDQVDSRFELGVASVPLPMDHPDYGHLVKGPRSEVGVSGGNPLAITRNSPHTDVCLAFLQYATSPGPDEAFNESTFWLPMVKTADVSRSLLEPFKPEMQGYAGRFKHGGEWDGQNSQFRVLSSGFTRMFSTGKFSPEEYAAKMTDAYEALSEQGIDEIIEQRLRTSANFERVEAGLMFMALAGPVDDHESYLRKLTNLTASIQKQFFETNAQRDLHRLAKVSPE